MSGLAEQQIVIFQVSDAMYGVPIERVREIMKYKEVTRLPQVDSSIEGILNLREVIVPVLCLRKRFNLVDGKGKEDLKIIIMDVRGNSVGFIVDAVKEVFRLSSDRIEPLPTAACGMDTSYLSGIGKTGEQMVILLDVDRLIEENEMPSMASASL